MNARAGLSGLAVSRFVRTVAGGLLSAFLCSPVSATQIAFHWTAPVHNDHYEAEPADSLTDLETMYVYAQEPGKTGQILGRYRARNREGWKWSLYLDPARNWSDYIVWVISADSTGNWSGPSNTQRIPIYTTSTLAKVGNFLLSPFTSTKVKAVPSSR